MPLTRTLSMPEAPSFPMKLRETTAMTTLQEEGVEGKETMAKEETEVTQELAEGDFGFYAMDDSSSEMSSNPSEMSSNPAEPSPSTGSIRKKPAIRRGSAYGDDAIPLDFEQRKFNRVLPKPDLTKRESAPASGEVYTSKTGMIRVASEPVFVRPVYHAYQEVVSNDEEKDVLGDDSASGSSSGDRRVSYGTIQIREHSQTLGDNPSVSYGTPVQLDWLSEDLEHLDIDLYEEYKPAARNKRNMQLNSFQRVDLLKQNGHSAAEISTTKKETDKVKGQRDLTKFIVTQYPQVMLLNDVLESGLRKLKRLGSKSKSNKNKHAYPTKEQLLDMMDKDISNATAAF